MILNNDKILTCLKVEKNGFFSLRCTKFSKNPQKGAIKDMAEAYLGTYEQSLDAKNRFTIPASFKDDLPEQMNILVTMGKYPHIDFFPDESVYKSELAQRKANMSRSTPAPIIQALFNGNTDKVSFDKQGRTNAIPSRLLENAKIYRDMNGKCDLMVMGNINFISVYHKDIYNTLMSDASSIMTSRDEAMLSATYKDDENIANGNMSAFGGME